MKVTSEDSVTHSLHMTIQREKDKMQQKLGEALTQISKMVMLNI